MLLQVLERNQHNVHQYPTKTMLLQGLERNLLQHWHFIFLTSFKIHNVKVKNQAKCVVDIMEMIDFYRHCYGLTKDYSDTELGNRYWERKPCVPQQNNMQCYEYGCVIMQQCCKEIIKNNTTQISRFFRITNYTVTTGNWIELIALFEAEQYHVLQI